MRYLRSFLFVPASKKNMLDKISEIDSDAFILDLEDSVSSGVKADARKNVASILSSLKEKGKNIFVRINEAGSEDSIKDLKKTYSPIIDGFVIPKFENTGSVKDIIEILEELEGSCNNKKTGLILMIESPKGVLGLRRLALSNNNTVLERLKGIALGGEDYLESITVSRNLSKEVLAPIRNEIMIFSHSFGILAIDTVYPNFRDKKGLEEETHKIASMGFTSKLAIHPSQTGIINKAFYPRLDEIEKIKLIISRKEEIIKEGAIDINGEMYDMPHLKWALKLKKYIYDTEKG